MNERVIKLIESEDKRNPYTDAEIAKKLNIKRETVTLIRSKEEIPDSRQRRKELLFSTIKRILNENSNISERELTKQIKNEGFKVSRYIIRELLKDITREDNDFINDNGAGIKNTKDNKQMKNKEYKAFNNIIGSESSLKPFIQQAKAAMLYPPHGLHTLILGATGVGKSELANSMYEFAKEAGIISNKAPFIIFNCADYADNPQLLMAQLFGYVKGAFTGADSDKEGLVEKANKSLLFLDEVHRLPPEGQELLFYLIDKGKFRRLGETEIERKVRITIIAATTENPDSMLLTTFRRRIPMVIELPSLNERPLNERLEIIKEFIKKEASRTKHTIKVSNEALRAFLLYDCPGNVGQLRSDIQVSCARSFLNNVVNQTDSMHITISELPSNARKGLLKTQSNRYEIEQLVGNEDIVIHPQNISNEEWIKQDIYTLPNQIYQHIETRYHNLQSQGLNQEIVNYIVGSEMEEKLEKLIKKVESNIRPIEKKDLIKIVGIEVINALDKVMKIAKWKLEVNVEKLYYVLAVHLSTTIERLKKGKMIKNPQLEKIKKIYHEEFQVAVEMMKVLQNELNVQLPEDEAGYITMYLRMTNQEQEDEEEGRVGVLIISHGNVASGMADVANRLLGVMYAKSIEMSLDESPEVALERAIEVVKRIDEGKGVLILVDMGSLITFGELITKRTGIKTRCLSRTDSVMVIEAVRRAMIPGANLDEIADTLEEKTKYVSRLVKNDKQITNKKHTKPPVIITMCITGQGAAQKVKELIENIENEIRIIPIGAMNPDVKDFILDIHKENTVVAIVGSVNPQIDIIPFISLEDIVKGRGIKQLKQLLNNEKTDITNLQDNDKCNEIKDVIYPELTLINKEFKNKEEAIFELSKLLVENKFVTEGFIYSVLKREQQGNTYLKGGVAIPHGEENYVLKPSIAIATLKEEIEWDGNKTKLILMISLKSNCINIVHDVLSICEDEQKVLEIIDQDDFNSIKNIFSMQ